jgi:hypothetical protein
MTMNRRTMIAILTSLLSIGAIAATASAASWHWFGWEASAAANQTSSCYAPTPVIGHSVINGNDAGQVIAYCADTVNNVWDCGAVHGTEVGVQGRGRASGGAAWEYTPGTFGPSVGSTAGGAAIAEHQCQMGYWY